MLRLGLADANDLDEDRIMTVPPDEDSEGTLRAKIRAAFPDVVFAGAITPVDGSTRPDLDEELALYATLRGKRWSEIPVSFVRECAYSVVLLTDAAFAAFLAAWLMRALEDETVREPMVYTFSPDSQTLSTKIQFLSDPQKEVICMFLAHCVAVESSAFVKEHAQRALVYLSGFLPANGSAR